MASRTTRDSTKRKTEESSQANSSSKGNQNKRPKTAETKATTSSKAKSKPEDTSKEDGLLNIEEQSGDIFAAPSNALIIHACNSQGSWGAGIAAAFKQRYPEAFKEHLKHCRNHSSELIDSAQLISPVDAKAGGDEGEAATHFVGCLFTSRGYGRNKDSPSRILQATKPAMEDLLKQVKVWNASAAADDKVGEVRICQINSGLFKVPWKKTKDMLESIDVSDGDVKTIKCISLPSK